MTLAELIKELMDTSKERMRTPISGAFLWSFIIYNWRPITVLLFSNATIEDKIVVINYVYCKHWAITIPVLIALIYTVCIPMLMVEIDKILLKTTKSRVDNIYESKEHLADKKILLAAKEFELKNAESGNKQISDLMQQIETLDKANSEMLAANQNTINQLSTQLQVANNNLVKFKKSNENIPLYYDFFLKKIQQAKSSMSPELSNLFSEKLDGLSLSDVELFRKIKIEDGIMVFNSDDSKLGVFISELIKMELADTVSKNGKSYFSLTKLGAIIYNIFN